MYISPVTSVAEYSMWQLERETSAVSRTPDSRAKPDPLIDHGWLFAGKIIVAPAEPRGHEQRQLLSSPRCVKDQG